MPRAGVLPGKIDCGLLKRIEADVDKALDVAGRSVAGHEHVAEGVYRRLNENIGTGEQRALDACGQADAENLLQLRLVKAHFAEIQLAGVGSAHQGDDHQHGGKRLRNDGRQRHTGHVHMEPDDKNQV